MMSWIGFKQLLSYEQHMKAEVIELGILLLAVTCKRVKQRRLRRVTNDSTHLTG